MWECVSCLRQACCCILLMCTFVPISFETDVEDVVVTLPDGKQLRGARAQLTSGTSAYKFYGIPYASAPTGERRFKSPEAPLPWAGIKDVRSDNTICPQASRDQTVTMTEDCLLLNVFTANLNSSLPVLVWIHLGGYKVGSKNWLKNPFPLLERGIVVVAINYRLGPLGFFSSGDEVMPGNYGMLDQVFSLKWVQENIAVFGGDARQVTLNGVSAGAHSASLLTISPLSQGLFHRAIIESGSALCGTAVERPGSRHSVADYTLHAAALLACNQTSSLHLIHCLRQLQSADILEASNQVEHDFGISMLAIPRVETTFGFLPDYPEDLLEQTGNFTSVDTLRGFNSGEWSSVIDDPQNDGINRTEFTTFFESLRKLSSFVTNDQISQLVRKAYLRDETDPIKIRSSLVNALSDMTFAGAALVEVTKYETSKPKESQHYFYQFSYRSSSLTSPVWYGVPHASELQFLFFDPQELTNATWEDRLVAETIQDLWANFIKYGNPTPERKDADNGFVRWDVFSSLKPMIMNIDVHLSLVTHPRPNLVAMYEQILKLMRSAVSSDKSDA